MKKNETYESLIKMAKEYSCDKNALFIQAASQYAVQQKVIDDIKKMLSEEDDYLTTKEYVKGRENVYANPLVKELPKHADSANRTAQTILSIIEQFGTEPVKESKLSKMMAE